VEYGQDLLTLEAMKMKNAIRATRAGTIAAVHVNVGDQVQHGQVLLEFTD
jgi:biotin carboxyl carrier protein